MKKPPMIFGFLVLTLLGLQVGAQDGELVPVAKKPVTDRIMLYQTGLTAASPNMVAIKTSKGVVVVDALQDPDLAKRVRKMITADFGAPVACLINTHGAYDHTLGNEAFADVPIYGHQDVKAEMERFVAMGKTPQAAQFFQGEMKKAEAFRPQYPGDPREIDESLEGYRDLQKRLKSDAVKAVVPTVAFGDRYDLNMGDRTLIMAHNTPSYSRTDIVIFIPEEKTVIVGDIFNKKRLPSFSPPTDLGSWEKLFSDFLAPESDTKHFVGTHGDVMTADEVREQFKYLRRLYDEVKRLKGEEKALDEAKKELALEKFPYLSAFNPYFYGTANHVHNLNISAVWNQLRITPAEARKIIADGNVEWGRARVAYDRPTFERMLAPDFYVQLQDRKLTRQEFIDGISVAMPGGKLTRFDATVLTVRPSADGWVALIHEKIEIETPGGKSYSLWITRDGWRKVNNRWLISYSEAIGSENWTGGAKPPFLDW